MTLTSGWRGPRKKPPPPAIATGDAERVLITSASLDPFTVASEAGLRNTPDESASTVDNRTMSNRIYTTVSLQDVSPVWWLWRERDVREVWRLPVPPGVGEKLPPPPPRPYRVAEQQAQGGR